MIIRKKSNGRVRDRKGLKERMNVADVGLPRNVTYEGLKSDIIKKRAVALTKEYALNSRTIAVRVSIINVKVCHDIYVTHMSICT